VQPTLLCGSRRTSNRLTSRVFGILYFSAPTRGSINRQPLTTNIMSPPLTHPLLSPPELSYTHASLLLTPPIRPDARTPTQFRPLIAETNILPGTNGSGRICFPDGNEAVVGVKAEVERSLDGSRLVWRKRDGEEAQEGRGENAWVELTIEIPGLRDDDALPVFLAAMLNEALLASGDLVDRLWINHRWHWKLYIDVSLSGSIFPPICLYLRLCITDPPHLPSTLLPNPSSLSNDSPRPPIRPLTPPYF
jgi:exosome complex component RRP42